MRILKRCLGSGFREFLKQDVLHYASRLYAIPRLKLQAFSGEPPIKVKPGYFKQKKGSGLRVWGSGFRVSRLWVQGLQKCLV